jgi:hypothetical protein
MAHGKPPKGQPVLDYFGRSNYTYKIFTESERMFNIFFILLNIQSFIIKKHITKPVATCDYTEPGNGVGARRGSKAFGW